jgi:hypothetical protein
VRAYCGGAIVQKTSSRRFNRLGGIVLFAEPIAGFIAPKNNGEGIVQREKRNVRGKVKQQNAMRQKYVFVTASKRGQRYRDYFNPNSAVQLRVMGMEDTVVRALPQLPNKLLFSIYLVAGNCNAVLQVPEPY